MSKKTYIKLASHYEKCLEMHGDTSLGMDWPKEKDNLRRHQVMAEFFTKKLGQKEKKTRVLDFGCGTSHFYDFLRKKGWKNKIEYIGVDILEKSIAISKSKYPKNSYYCFDILSSRRPIPSCDYIVINGLFTQKREMSDQEMKKFFKKILLRLYPAAKSGLAFNTMSDQVDFKRRGAFHLDLNWAAKFFADHLTRHFVVRHDYGLYENTFYLFKKERH
jgi:SAM-dependent methyltransferase